ncbi:MAG TPA: TonB-dependent receptor plug domain-containing protein, partial [Steroidobacteraceae bacterium]
MALLLLTQVLAAQPQAGHRVGLTNEISAQPLQTALETFAKDTGYQVIYRPELVRAVATQGAEAGLSVTETLRELLRGTGLGFDLINDNAVVITGAKRESATGSQTTAKETALPGTALAAIGASSAGELPELIVTATRREEDIQRVPISISAITQEQIDVLGVRQITDIAKFTPGLFISGGQGTNNNLSIRGIAATSGAATTGIYIDDTPIQARNNGFVPGSALPSLFDLQRVEVLKGPQGTLFGAGSEGGTVRFVLTQP